jgi:diaminopimelate epimerase
MNVPFLKAHGAGNDFLFTFEKSLRQPVEENRLPGLAKAICSRHAGVGADGWYLIRQPSEGHHAEILLFNSDGSKAELSGNGTRCAAAILIDAGLPTASVRILTGAGPRHLKSLERNGRWFRFEMDMGRPLWKDDELRLPLELKSGAREAAILDVGNPQCAVLAGDLNFDWRLLGAEIENHSRFPNRTNVSFLRKIDDHTIEARFWERGAGATLSSGTGSVGAAAAAVLLGLAGSPVRVVTEAGDLEVIWGSRSAPVAPRRIETPAPAVPVPPPKAGEEAAAGEPPAEPLLEAQPLPPPIVSWSYPAPEGPARLVGPAEVVATGEFFWTERTTG